MMRIPISCVALTIRNGSPTVNALHQSAVFPSFGIEALSSIAINSIPLSAQ
jgi:hypothetical protein